MYSEKERLTARFAVGPGEGQVRFFLSADIRPLCPNEDLPDEEPLEPAKLKRLHAEREFQSPVWSLGHILSWIAFGIPVLICQFKSRFSPFTQQFRSNLRSWPMRVERPDQELLGALQDGKLKAITNEKKLSRSYWTNKDVRHLTADLRFYRDKAMRTWCAESDVRRAELAEWGNMRYGAAPSGLAPGASVARALPRQLGDAEPALSVRPTSEDIAEPKSPETPTPSDRAAVRVSRPIDAQGLQRHIEGIKKKGGPIPARATVVDLVRKAFPNNHVTRRAVEKVHVAVFGRQRPGPRRNNLTENSAK